MAPQPPPTRHRQLPRAVRQRQLKVEAAPDDALAAAAAMTRTTQATDARASEPEQSRAEQRRAALPRHCHCPWRLPLPPPPHQADPPSCPDRRGVLDLQVTRSWRRRWEEERKIDTSESRKEGGRERGTNDTGGRIAPAALTDGIFHGYARGNASQFTPPSPPPESPLPMLPAFCSSAFSCVCLFDSLVLSLFFSCFFLGH
jgi:hypothetical protein